MNILTSIDSTRWDAFLASQRFRPFLQSWTMGQVYADIGQEPVRLAVESEGRILAICFAHIVPARRGRHLSVPYGPVWADSLSTDHRTKATTELLAALREKAAEHHCTFVRMSPFAPAMTTDVLTQEWKVAGAAAYRSPLHLLAEHVWYLPLKSTDPWDMNGTDADAVAPDALFKNFRSTTRNLIRRAEKEDVKISASEHPEKDVEIFIGLHDETRKRHKFTPYSNAFFRAQVLQFAHRGECTVYLAHYNGNVIASSIHMHAFGETSYHHGASAEAFKKIPGSYLLQWRAIEDALKRGDRIYNFWGIAPEGATKHPFAGVTLFKTGFGGKLLNLPHCIDIAISKKYHITRGFEYLRKWRRGF